VGVVKLRVLQGLWRRLVGVGIIGTGLSGSGLYTAPWPRCFAFLPIAFGAAFTLPCCALRWVVGGATMSTPGGAGTSCQSVPATPPCSAHRLLSWGRSPLALTGLRPFACPGPIPQGVSYVQISGLGSYIRNKMPIRAPAGLSRVQSKPLPGRAWTLHPSARPDLFHPST
jgi:hypothetical protein